MGKSSINEPFSIAMLVYQRVYMYMYLLVAAGMSLSTLFGMMFQIWDRLKPPASIQKFNGRSMAIAMVAMPVDFAKCPMFFCSSIHSIK